MKNLARYTASMDDGYRALARAIREPMRRWWLRVGLWWAATALLLYLGSAVVLTKPWGITAHHQWSSLLLDAAELLYFGLWLFAAWHVVSVSRGIVEGFLHPRPTELLRLQFRLVLWHTLPLLLVLVAYMIALAAYQVSYYGFGTSSEPLVRLLPHHVLVALASPLAVYAGQVVFMLWLVSLMLVLPSKPWLAVQLFVAANVLPRFIDGLHQALILAIPSSRGLFSIPNFHVPYEPTGAWVVGCAAFFAMIHCYVHSRKEAGNALAALLTLLGTLYGFAILGHSIERTVLRFSLTGQIVNFVRSSFDFLNAPLINHAYTFSNRTVQILPISEYYLSLPGQLVKAPGWLTYWLPLINALYVAAVYAFIYYVVLAPPRQRRATSKTDVQMAP